MNTYESADLSSVAYDGWYNKDTGVFTVYSMYNSQPIEKVIFKGSYNKKDNLGRTITTQFKNFAIKFDGGWDQDILLELNSFAYVAPSGCVALDFSAVQSENITINVVGSSSITAMGGATAIKANNNLSIVGSGDFTVQGGNGVNATTAGGNGADGGVGILADNLIVALTGNVIVNGGDGGQGANGANATTSGANGSDGGVGGNGGVAISATSIALSQGNLTVTGGEGGNGGNGGNGAVGHHPAYREVSGWTNHDDAVNQARGGKAGYTGGRGGNGGNGGNGGASGYALKIDSLTIELDATLVANESKSGRGGNGGNGGNGGKGQSIKQTSIFGNAQPGQGGDGGDGGNGGNTGKIMDAISITEYSLDNVTINECAVLEIGNGGNAGSGGEPGSKSGNYSDWYAEHGAAGKQGSDGVCL